jgi:putative hydrolase of the HAD superfamily
MPPYSADADGSAVLVFDLDDTLYLERDFVRSGFVAVGEYLERQRGITGFAEICLGLFSDGLRSKVFDAALAQMALPCGAQDIATLVEVYRCHRPLISLAPDAARFLAADTCKRAMITDGPAQTQRAKIESLGIAGLFGLVLTTGSWGEGFGKPHPRAFAQVMQWSGAAARQHIYIADNPAKDFLAPRQLHWRSVQVNRPGRIHDPAPCAPTHAADAEICSFDELAAIVSRLVRQPG